MEGQRETCKLKIQKKVLVLGAERGVGTEGARGTHQIRFRPRGIKVVPRFRQVNAALGGYAGWKRPLLSDGGEWV